MIHDRIPEIREDFTITVLRADGTQSSASYDQDQPVDEAKLDALAKEITNERRRTD